MPTLKSQKPKTFKLKKKSRVSEAKLYGGILLGDVRKSLINLTRSQKAIPRGLE